MTTPNQPSMLHLAIIAADLASRADRLKLNVLDIRIDGLYSLVRVHIFGGHTEGDALLADLGVLAETDTEPTSTGTRQVLDCTYLDVRVVIDTYVLGVKAAA